MCQLNFVEPGRRRQHRASFEVAAEEHAARALAELQLDLREIGHVRAEPVVRIGVRQQPPGRADDERLGVLAELLRIEKGRQKLEIDLGHGRTGIAAGMLDRDGHERVRTVEINRRKPHRTLLRFLETCVARIVDTAALDKALAREAQLFLSRAVELNDAFDRRHLLQQQRIIGTPLFERGGARPGRPTDLPFDLGNVLLDPPGHSLGLLGLGIGQELGHLRIGEPGLERAVDGEHEHQQRGKRDDVFAEQTSQAEPALVKCLGHWNSRIDSIIYVPATRPPQVCPRHRHGDGTARDAMRPPSAKSSMYDAQCPTWVSRDERQRVQRRRAADRCHAAIKRADG